MKAIIIEDETAALSSLKAVLQQNSVVEIEVIAELESIEDSVEWFQCSLQPDLIFMDIQMPEMNGYEATQAIRSLNREDSQSIPIFALSADAYVENKRYSKKRREHTNV